MKFRFNISVLILLFFCYALAENTTTFQPQRALEPLIACDIPPTQTFHIGDPYGPLSSDGLPLPPPTVAEIEALIQKQRQDNEQANQIYIAPAYCTESQYRYLIECGGNGVITSDIQQQEDDQILPDYCQWHHYVNRLECGGSGSTNSSIE